MFLEFSKPSTNPNTNFLNASLGHNPSVSCTSIWSAQAIVREGCRLRVGSGENLRVWGDAWLRGKTHASIQSEPTPYFGDLTVRDLFLPRE